MPSPTASPSAARIRRWSCVTSEALLALFSTACAKHYKADGMVLRVNSARQSVLVSHRDIPGYMPAMAMEFHATHPSDLQTLKPGTRIFFQLDVSRKAAAISHIAPRTGIGDIAIPKPVPPAIGAIIPDFTLTDQSKNRVQLSGLRGQVIAINFIYTRCPLPDVCPRLSANFGRLQRRFGNRITLLSISIDPQHDTPEELSRYAKLWKADPASWHFLTGGVREIQTVASSFGVLYFAEDDAMTHTSETAVIGRDGRLAGIVEGSAYAVSQLGDLIALALEVP